MEGKVPDWVLRFEGTALEIGQEVWSRLCLPAVGAASRQMSEVEKGRMYAGFVISAWGAMTADFGHELAADFARQMADEFIRIAPTIEDDGSAGVH